MWPLALCCYSYVTPREKKQLTGPSLSCFHTFPSPPPPTPIPRAWMGLYPQQLVECTQPESGWAQSASPCSPGLEGATPTPLSHSSMASPSPAVLLKLLVLEDEREMLARPFSFNFMKGLWERERDRPGHSPRPSPRQVRPGSDSSSLWPLPAGFCVSQSSQGKKAGSTWCIPGLQAAPAGPGPCPHPRSLTSPC